MDLLNGEGNEKEEENIWTARELTNRAKYRLENLEKFSEYKLKLEASNRFGPINCTFLGRHFSEHKLIYTYLIILACSKLESPANFRLEFLDGQMKKRPILVWERVNKAAKYKIKYRRKEEGANYRELASGPKKYNHF